MKKTPIEELYDKALQNKREGKNVISVDYVISKIEKEQDMYKLKRYEGA